MANFAIHQHQKNLMQQMNGYSSMTDYNFQKLIRYYKDAINSAESPDVARSLATGLESVLSQKGQGLSDVKGLNTNLLNAAAPTANQANPNTAANTGKVGGKQKGDTKDQQIIADLSQEFGIDVKKSGTTKDWLEKAKKDQNVRILDPKTGQDVTNEREGRIKKGDILEVNSKKHGLVKIAVGGDGEINGKDDKVISTGGKAAAGNMLDGLNQINNNVPNQANPNQVNNTANTATNPFAALGIAPEQAAQNAQFAQNPEAQQGLFTDAQIKSLIAAILNQSIYSMEQNDYMKQMQGVM
jgi:hypothetical protein